MKIDAYSISDRFVIRLRLVLIGFILVFFVISAPAQSFPELRASAKDIIKDISKLKKKYPHFKKFKASKKLSESKDTSFWISMHYEHNMKKVENSKKDAQLKSSATINVPDEKDGISLTLYFFRGQWTGQALPYKQYQIGKMNMIFFLSAGEKTKEIFSEIEKIISTKQAIFNP